MWGLDTLWLPPCPHNGALASGSLFLTSRLGEADEVGATSQFLKYSGPGPLEPWKQQLRMMGQLEQAPRAGAS